MKAILLGIFLTVTAWGIPEKIELVDGRTLEKVTAVQMEGGKIRILHSAGVSRLEPEKVTAASLKEIGGEFAGVEVATKPVLALTRLETLDGKIYEGLRNVRMKPSFIQFLHESGATSVRFDNLPEAIRQQCGYDKALADEFDKAKAQAEAAMAKAEYEFAKNQARAQMAAEIRQRRQRAIWELEVLSYGDDRYWGSGQRGRMLQDMMVQRHLQEAGFNPSEAAVLMDRKRFQ